MVLARRAGVLSIKGFWFLKVLPAQGFRFLGVRGSLVLRFRVQGVGSGGPGSPKLRKFPTL